MFFQNFSIFLKTALLNKKEVDLRVLLSYMKNNFSPKHLLRSTSFGKSFVNFFLKKKYNSDFDLNNLIQFKKTKKENLLIINQKIISRSYNRDIKLNIFKFKNIVKYNIVSVINEFLLQNSTYENRKYFLKRTNQDILKNNFRNKKTLLIKFLRELFIKNDFLLIQPKNLSEKLNEVFKEFKFSETGVKRFLRELEKEGFITIIKSYVKDNYGKQDIGVLVGWLLLPGPSKGFEEEKKYTIHKNDLNQFDQKSNAIINNIINNYYGSEPVDKTGSGILPLLNFDRNQNTIRVEKNGYNYIFGGEIAFLAREFYKNKHLLINGKTTLDLFEKGKIVLERFKDNGNNFFEYFRKFNKNNTPALYGNLKNIYINKIINKSDLLTEHKKYSKRLLYFISKNGDSVYQTLKFFSLRLRIPLKILKEILYHLNIKNILEKYYISGRGHLLKISDNIFSFLKRTPAAIRYKKNLFKRFNFLKKLKKIKNVFKNGVEKSNEKINQSVKNKIQSIIDEYSMLGKKLGFFNG